MGLFMAFLSFLMMIYSLMFQVAVFIIKIAAKALIWCVKYFIRFVLWFIQKIVLLCKNIYSNIEARRYNYADTGFYPTDAEVLSWGWNLEAFHLMDCTAEQAEIIKQQRKKIAAEKKLEAKKAKTEAKKAAKENAHAEQA